MPGGSSRKAKISVKKRDTNKGKRNKHTVPIKKVNTGNLRNGSSRKLSDQSLVTVPNNTALARIPQSSQLPGWNHQTNKRSFGGHRIAFTQLETGPDMAVGDNFLSYLTGLRSNVVRMGVDKILQGKTVPLEHQDKEGNVFQLISSKECDDNTAGGTLWAPKKKLLELFYMLTSGPNMEPVDAGAYLCRFGNFAKLPSRKVASRLELFQSPGRLLSEQYVLEFSKHNFVDMKESGHEGCGFIDEEMLYDIIGRKKDGEPTKLSASTLCIQVRIYIPSRGKFCETYKFIFRL